MLKYTGFQFCPSCGSTHIEGHSNNAMRCNACGYTYFHNVAAAVGGIIMFKENLVLLKRGHEPQKHKLDVPGGFVDYNETLEEAMIREVNEETGFKLLDLNYYTSSSNQYIYKNVSYFTSDAFFTARVDNIDSFQASEEVPELHLIKPSELNIDDLAFVSVKKIISQFINSK